MANSYQVAAGDRLYTIVDDVATQYQVLATGRVLAAATGLPLPAFTVRVDHAGVFVKAGGDGFFCLAGNQTHLFPALAVQPYALALTISAPHHQTISTTAHIPAGATFPQVLAPVTLAYRPVRLQGRVVLAVDGSSVAGALVTIAEPTYLTLRTPLHFDQLAGANVQATTINPAGPPRTLTAGVTPSDTALILDNTAGLAANAILQIGAAVDREYSFVDATGPQPGVVQLRGQLNRSYPAGTVVQAVTSTTGGPLRTLNQTAARGDGLLWLDAPLTGDVVAILAAGPAQNEIHALNALSNAAGYYRIDGVSRLHGITIHAQDAGNTSIIDQPWTIDPRTPVNRIDLQLAAP